LRKLKIWIGRRDEKKNAKPERKKQLHVTMRKHYLIQFQNLRYKLHELIHNYKRRREIGKLLLLQFGFKITVK